MTTKGTPSQRYKWRPSEKDLKKSYQVRIAAVGGDTRAKNRLKAYNQRVKERKMEANQADWSVDGHLFNRYKLMDYIVTLVSSGEPLPVVCDHPGMPSMQIVYSWFDNHPEFERDMRRAEEIRGHRLGEEALRIALETDRENVAADKLKVETLSKAAARTNNRFQDRQVVQNEDEFARMTPEQLRQRISRMVVANPELGVLVSGHLSSVSQAEPETVLPEQTPDLPSLGHAQSDIHSAVDIEPIQEDHSLSESDSDL